MSARAIEESSSHCSRPELTPLPVGRPRGSDHFAGEFPDAL